MRILAAAALPVCLLAHAGVAAAAWTFDAGAGAVYEDNVGLGSRKGDIKSDTALAALLSAGPVIQLDDRNAISLIGTLGGKLYERFTGLDVLTAGAGAAFKRKLGLGYQAPWWRLTGGVERQAYDNDIRDSWVARLGTGVGRRFGERWDLRADYTWERRFADHEGAGAGALAGDVWDVEGHTFSFRTDFQVDARVALFAGYALRDGDVVSTTRRNPEIFQSSKAVARDPVFGADTFAYRIHALAHTLSAGVSVADNIVRLDFLYSF